MTENNYGGFSEESLRRIALRKVHFRMSVKIHVGVFITVNILMLLLNLFFTPYFIWMIFPFFGWLIGVAEHITAYLIYARGVYPTAKRGVIFHSIAYIFVMLYLFVLNILFTPFFYWALFPAVFWGAGLVINAIAYFIYYRPSTDERGGVRSRTQRAVEKEIEKMKRRMNK